MVFLLFCFCLLVQNSEKLQLEPGVQQGEGAAAAALAAGAELVEFGHNFQQDPLDKNNLSMK